MVEERDTFAEESVETSTEEKYLEELYAKAGLRKNKVEKALAQFAEIERGLELTPEEVIHIGDTIKQAGKYKEFKEFNAGTVSQTRLSIGKILLFYFPVVASSIAFVLSTIALLLKLLA